MQPWCDNDLSPPLGAEVMNEWSYTLRPLYAFTVWTGTLLPLSHYNKASFLHHMCSHF